MFAEAIRTSYGKGKIYFNGIRYWGSVDKDGKPDGGYGEMVVEQTGKTLVMGNYENGHSCKDKDKDNKPNENRNYLDDGEPIVILDDGEPIVIYGNDGFENYIL
ncbi:hypothetical protein FACS1894152_8680 [Bacilli bacterium]|nr:hypothetical protein FACS1894152_8680 [Bacilli bacterium]